MCELRHLPSPGTSLRHLSGWIVLALLECLVLAEFVLAYRDDFLNVAQMRHRGFEHGLPFVWHFAMWGDLLVISPLAAYLVHRFHPRWHRERVTLSLVVGFISSAALHWTYRFAPFPETHVVDHALTGAGWVHLLYMGFAISIFIQFFLFTETVSTACLCVVSALVFLHVFVGTHMLLGLINLAYPQDWYAGEPLKSLAGWMIITLVGITLLWRNFRDVDVSSWTPLVSAQAKYPSVRKLVAFGRFISLQRTDTTLRYLKSLDWIADKLKPTSFFLVFAGKVQLAAAFSGGVFRLDNWISFIRETALPCLLMVMVALMYFFGRHSVKLELDLGPKLFSPRRMPTKWGKPRDRLIVFFSVTGYLLFFLVLTWYADHIRVAAAILFILACNDWRTRYLIGDGIAAYLGDPRYDPPPEDPDSGVIQRRRVVARRFLYAKPHLFKETCKAVGCGVAFALAIVGYFRGTNQYDVLAYVILIATLMINEYFSVKWRMKMFYEMEEAESNS
jgi:hypothetical protein